MDMKMHGQNKSKYIKYVSPSNYEIEVKDRSSAAQLREKRFMYI
jgi:hypothetical protein